VGVPASLPPDPLIPGDNDLGVPDVGWILWSGTIGFASPVTARAAAASEAGYGRISVSPADVLTAGRQGIQPAELGRHIREFGLDIVLDAVLNWHGCPRTGWPFAGRSDPAGYQTDLDEVLAMSEALQVVAMNAVGPATCDRPTADLAEPFSRLCDRAAAFGAQVTLEFMPMLAVGSLMAAWSIVSGADRDNGGLVLDTWHFFRAGPDFATLEAIPAGRIFATQISDGAAVVHGSLVDDTFRRLMPGAGSFDLDHMVRVLDRLGGLRWVGPEVISPATAAAEPTEISVAARQRIADLIRRNRSAG
jgi:sugar phosphate isomerase/epimerase